MDTRSINSTGAYRTVISSYAGLSDPTEALSYYCARAHLALVPAQIEMARNVLGSSSTLDATAINQLANYYEGDQQALLECDELIINLGEQGLQPEDEGRHVRAVVATLFLNEGSQERRDEAIEILREGVEIGQDQEWSVILYSFMEWILIQYYSLAVLTHLYLTLSLPTHASATLLSPSVTAFTADSLLSQLLLAQIALLSGPTTKYQEAYYVYEEIKGMQGGRAEGVLNGLAIAQATQGRWDEATAALTEAQELVSILPIGLGQS